MSKKRKRNETKMLRRIPFDKIENFRDLGGYSARYGETSFGVVYRSGSLSDATPDDVDKLAKIGIKTIIDLRNDKDKTEKPDRTKGDPRFINISLSVNGNGRVPVNRVDMINSYIEMLEDPEQAKRIFLTIAHCEKPCVIHCTAGKDRTGCFCAVLELANGVPFHDVNADYMLSFAYLTRLCKITKKTMPDFPSAVLTPSAEFLKKVFVKFNKKWGKVDEYFSKIGLSKDDITLLNNLLGRQEKSCGAVVFHNDTVLIEHMKKGHYSIPKGHVETYDLNDQATALREIREETGLAAKILSDETYRVDYSPEKGAAKKVLFFVASSDETKTTPQAEEVADCSWMNFEDAIRVLTHESDKQIVRWAFQIKSTIKTEKTN
jgi:protein tyrosine/serine phosphatase/8-oxo-dGTP pyrophosphatase MutT (NUDIX family)